MPTPLCPWVRLDTPPRPGEVAEASFKVILPCSPTDAHNGAWRLTTLGASHIGAPLGCGRPRPNHTRRAVEMAKRSPPIRVALGGPALAAPRPEGGAESSSGRPLGHAEEHTPRLCATATSTRPTPNPWRDTPTQGRQPRRQGPPPMRNSTHPRHRATWHRTTCARSWRPPASRRASQCRRGAAASPPSPAALPPPPTRRAPRE